jgi:hypothetical protein
MSGQQTGTSTLTAANGDTFTFSFVGTIDATGPDPTDPVNFEGVWEIIAGTGRFADASGSGTYNGSAAGPRGMVFLVGSITRVHTRP